MQMRLAYTAATEEGSEDVVDKKDLGGARVEAQVEIGEAKKDLVMLVEATMDSEEA